MLFLSFLTSLSPLTFSRPMYTFVGLVTHYSCRLGLMVFFTIYTVNSLWPSSLGFSIHWASTNGPQQSSTCFIILVFVSNSCFLYNTNSKSSLSHIYIYIYCTGTVFRPNQLHEHDIEAQPINFNKPRTPSPITGCMPHQSRS